WVGGMSEREGSVMGSEEVIDSIGGMGGKKVTGEGRGCVGHLGILEVCDGEMGCCILGLPVDGGYLASVEG
ncbi:hypothetical protein KI387_026993, partial [Taxus chinensis]